MLTVYQNHFINTALAINALKFGEFTLKSGRISPYFFNAGAFADGATLTTMAQSYASIIKTLLNKGANIDTLFGPAYKGIPLVAAIATVLQLKYQINLPWAFSRKEIKNHGEGGIIVGSDLANKNVLIIDDVLTAGTAVRESLSILKNIQARPIGLVVALDRQEKIGEKNISALSQISQETGLFTRAIITLDDLLSFVQNKTELTETLAKLQEYRGQYGV